MSLQSNLLAAAIVGAAALASGCSSMHHTSMGANAAPTAGRLAAADLSFVTTAAGNDLYEIQVSQLAMQRGASAQVKNYAQMLVNHHTMSSNELKTILAAKGVTPPATLPPDKQAKMAQLQRLNGAEFDREYIRIAGVQDHQTAVTLFEQASRTLADADLRNFAAKTLPVLRQHLQSAQTIGGGLAG
ncbi:MAG TPA: DUF4142 domain-containing protein [Ramlibacter sp.]|jgi:putative membrane protein|nr:DUF4142 domain-containing protein [Ramlibacter sp.]